MLFLSSILQSSSFYILLGNENIHELTSHGRHKLRVELSSFNNKERYAEYSLFSVGDEQSNYQLIVNGYQGNAGKSLT